MFLAIPGHVMTLINDRELKIIAASGDRLFRPLDGDRCQDSRCPRSHRRCEEVPPALRGYQGRIQYEIRRTRWPDWRRHPGGLRPGSAFQPAA